ncbi:MAG: RnfABCDGE type electron transport complex subunit B [Bacteroidales bacterium]|jgi:Na+-translocating ferredoxin:NAD+ oxidoreductase RNF subunit RnfB|nr:RnfABCDGE type electron transport complex subunit B [Bacteroidales bacterium]
MSSTIIVTIISLSLLAAVSAVILYFVAQKFHVNEDPRIDDVQAALPAANCGGCGFAGCRNFAEALVAAETFDGLNCPVGGSEVMKLIAGMLGKAADETEPLTAVLLCNGTPEFRPRTTRYDGVESCRIQHNLYIGETNCSYGCLGNGDCVKACKFGAIKIDNSTKLPVIDDSKCVACGACVKSCPRNLIELRKKEKKDRKIYVACSNCDKGAIAIKACKAACIACSKCLKVCEFGAITIEKNLAHIDAKKCKLCRKCVAECSTKSILEFNFPPRKPKVETESITING